MKIKWDKILAWIKQRYDVILVWLAGILGVSCVVGTILAIYLQDSVETFQKKLSDLQKQIEERVEIPPSRAGMYRRALEHAEEYPVDARRYRRNIFTQWKEGYGEPPPPPPIQDASSSQERDALRDLSLIQTLRKPISLVWAGELTSQSGTYLYQMNDKGSTYFVKDGENVGSYTIVGREHGKLKILNTQSQEELFLDYKEVNMGNEYFAEIFVSAENRKRTVNIGSVVQGYTVETIMDNQVTLRHNNSGKQRTLSK